MTNRYFVLPALALLSVAIGWLVWNNLADNLVYYLTPSEAVEQRAEFPFGERFRLGGLIEEGGTRETGSGVRFLVGDGADTVTVLYEGTPPQLFREGIGVVVEGSWDGDYFRSDALLIHHDEQYRAVDGAGAYEVPSSGP